MTRSLGIDISRYQDNPDTSKRFDFAKAVANNADFIFIKASQSSYADRDFLYNWMSAGDAGLLRGAYHYLSWVESAEAQAYFFTGLLKQEPGELPPVVDFESRYKLPIKSEMLRRLRTFCAIVNEQLGVDPIIYTGPSYWREFGSQDLSWERYPLWIANYGRKTPDVPLPWGSNEWTFWQYCVAPETPILTSNLEWVPAGDLDLDEELIGFDEQHTLRGLKLQRSRVLSNDIIKLPGVKIILANGETIRCTTEHPFLARYINKRGEIRTNIEWMAAQKIKEKMQKGIRVMLPRYFSLWEPQETWEAGYLAGAFDGEGSISTDHATHYSLQFAQNNNIMLENVLALLDRINVSYTNAFGHHHNCHKIYIRGGKGELLKLLGELRPPRIMNKVLGRKDLGRIVATKNIEIVEIKDIGTIDVVGLATSTKTYFSSGFASHNSDKGDGLAYGAESLQIDMNWYNGTREELFAWAGDNYVAPTYQICPLDETRCYRDE